MSQDPKERTDDSKKVAEHNLKEAEPLDKQDPTQPVEMGSSQATNAKPAGNTSSVSLWGKSLILDFAEASATVLAGAVGRVRPDAYEKTAAHGLLFRAVLDPPDQKGKRDPCIIHK